MRHRAASSPVGRLLRRKTFATILNGTRLNWTRANLGAFAVMALAPAQPQSAATLGPSANPSLLASAQITPPQPSTYTFQTAALSAPQPIPFATQPSQISRKRESLKGATQSKAQSAPTNTLALETLQQALTALLKTSSVRIKHLGIRVTLEGSGRALDCAQIFKVPSLPNIDDYNVHLEIEKKGHAKGARASLSLPALALPPLDQIRRLVLKKLSLQAAQFSLAAHGHTHLDRHGYAIADIQIDGHGLAHLIDLLVQAKLIDEGAAQVIKLSLLGFKAWKVLRGLAGSSVASSAGANVPPHAHLSKTKASEASDHIHVQCKDRRLFINDLAIADLKPLKL